MTENTKVIATSKTNSPIEIETSSPVRLGILGMSGSGKSVLMLNVALQLARTYRHRIQYICLDPKSSLWPLANRMAYPIVSEPTEFLPTLQKVEKIMLDRLDVMHKRGISKLDPIEDGDEFPQIVVICDELVSICSNVDLSATTGKQLKDCFTSILTRGRSSGIGMILASHTYAAELTIPTVARSQLAQRALMKSGMVEAKMMAEGMEEMCPAWTLSEPGSFFYSDGDWNIWKKARTFYTSDEKAREIADAYSTDVREIGLSWDVESPF